jgi:glycosyltransferase involved in cell wall biosynthesis
MMLKRCLAVVACSEPVRLSLAEALGVDAARATRLVAIPNGVEVPDPPAPGFRDEVRRRHGVAADALLVVAAGRLSHQKDFATLVDAAALLAPDFPRLRVVIGGEGELRSALEERVRARGVAALVSLPGNLLDLPDLLLAADVLAIPSRYEGLPLVLLEAMAAGLPVAGSRIPGIMEVVRDGESGLLVEAGSPGELARALGELLRDDDRRRRRGAAARERIAAEYGFARVLAQLEDVYRGARG